METNEYVAIMSELAKSALTSYFLYSRLAGMSEEEVHGVFLEEREKFRANKPEDLPDV